MIYLLIIIFHHTGRAVAIDHIEFNSSASCEITASSVRKLDPRIETFCVFKG
jgi:hypothetical protein